MKIAKTLLNMMIVMSEMPDELKSFVARILMWIILSPITAYAILEISDLIEKAWKSKNRRKKWVALTAAVFCAALITGLI